MPEATAPGLKGGWLPLFWGLAAPAAASSQAPIVVTAGFDTTLWLAPDAPIELRLSRPLDRGEERLAVFVGQVDLSPLFTLTEDRLTSRRRPVVFPSGASELVVYSVSAEGAWLEIGRVPLRVLTPTGFEQAELVPKLALNGKGQVLEGHHPAGQRPPRTAFQDFSLNLGLQSVHVRNAWTLRTQSNFLAVTNREEALRFPERADQAPRFDLSDYLVTVERGPALISAGNIAYGSHRHIVDGFQARGLSTVLRTGAASLTLAGMSGSRLVGWSNPSGLGAANHRLFGGTLGLEPFPHRPGLLRLEVSLFNGEVLPQAGFGQAAVIDAEHSRSVGLRVNVGDPSRRLALEAGYARTRFANPADPSLAQGATLVPVQPTTRGARYADLTLNLFRSLSPTPGSLPGSLALTLRHERIDPLYRSVAAPGARADLEQNGLQLAATIGALNAQVAHTRGHDNLAGIPTILTTLTRSTAVNLAFPLGSLFGPRPRSWLPMLSYSLARIHQYGDSVPTLGGFTPTFVPDQVSANHTLSLAWQATRWRVLYQLNRSSQDNRQEGRERSDLTNLTNNLSVGVLPASTLDLALDAALERAENREFSQRNSTWRLGTLLTWRWTSRNALVASVSRTRAVDDPRTLEQSHTEFRFEVSQRLSLFRTGLARSQAQLFLRYARLVGDRVVPLGARDLRRNWSLNTGFTLSAF